jgi:septation ring formation regulator EzrA
MKEQINEQLGLLEKELSRLKEVTDYIDETKKNAQEVIKTLESIQSNYSTYTEKIFTTCSNSIEQLKKETELSIKEGVLSFDSTGNKIDQTNREKLIETKKLLENYRKTVEATDNLVKTLEAVDFPSRLDSIEGKVKVNRILLIIAIVVGVGAILVPILL